MILFKKYKFLLSKNLLKALLLKRKIPLYVIINLTNKCQGRCKFCGIWERFGNEMTTQEIFCFIDGIADLGTRVVCFTGGEPLLREDIGGIMSYAKSKGLEVQLSSSGQLMPEKINYLKYVDLLHLSFDGPREVHDFQRYKGGYDDFLKAMKIAQAEDINLQTLTVLTKNNINSIEFIVDMAQANKFYAFFQPLDKTFFLDTPTPELQLSNEELRIVIEKLIQLKRKFKYIGNSLRGLRFILDGDKGYKCFAGKHFVYIHTNGDVYPCWVPPNIKALNCQEIGFKNALSGMPEFICSYCSSASTIELNYFFSFNFEVLFNLFIRKWKETKKYY